MITKPPIVTPLFSWPLMRALITGVDEENNFIKNLFKDKDNFKPNVSNLISKNKNILDYPELLNLKNDIQKIANQFAFETLAYREVVVDLKQSWINISQPGQGHPPHFHPNTIFVGTYYPFGSGGGPLDFRNPNNFQIIPNTNPAGSDPMGMISRPSILVQANPGEVMLWLSPMIHSVGNNIGKEDRFSLAFNFMVRGELGYMDNVSYLSIK